jgi:beta-glucan synthesis-associated protein KRE6
MDKPEPDDDLHRPDPRRDILNDSGSMFTLRGLANLGCLAFILLGIVTLLYVFFSPFFSSPQFSAPDVCGVAFRLAVDTP